MRSHGWKKGDVLLKFCVGVYEEGQMIRLVCDWENNISIICFVFAEKSGMSVSCFACVFVCARS